MEVLGLGRTGDIQYMQSDVVKFRFRHMVV